MCEGFRKGDETTKANCCPSVIRAAAVPCGSSDGLTGCLLPADYVAPRKAAVAAATVLKSPPPAATVASPPPPPKACTSLLAPDPAHPNKDVNVEMCADWCRPTVADPKHCLWCKVSVPSSPCSVFTLHVRVVKSLFLLVADAHCDMLTHPCTAIPSNPPPTPGVAVDLSLSVCLCPVFELAVPCMRGVRPSPPASTATRAASATARAVSAARSVRRWRSERGWADLLHVGLRPIALSVRRNGGRVRGLSPRRRDDKGQLLPVGDSEHEDSLRRGLARSVHPAGEPESISPSISSNQLTATVHRRGGHRARRRRAGYGRRYGKCDGCGPSGLQGCPRRNGKRVLYNGLRPEPHAVCRDGGRL